MVRATERKSWPVWQRGSLFFSFLRTWLISLRKTEVRFLIPRTEAGKLVGRGGCGHQYFPRWETQEAGRLLARDSQTVSLAGWHQYLWGGSAASRPRWPEQLRILTLYSCVRSVSSPLCIFWPHLPLPVLCWSCPFCLLVKENLGLTLFSWFYSSLACRNLKLKGILT